MLTEAPHVRIEMISQPRYLAGARSMIASIAQRLGFAEAACGQIALAIDEAICNVITHGYQKRPDGRIWISIWPISEPSPGIRILIEDEGKQVDPESIRSRDLGEIRPGGLGVHIIKHVMDSAEYTRRAKCGMALCMEKHIGSAKTAAVGAEGTNGTCCCGTG